MDKWFSRQISQKCRDFFCKNEFESVTTFIDGKVIECEIVKKEELRACHVRHVWQIERENNDKLTKKFTELI